MPKQKKLNSPYLNLPLEMFFEICSHLDPRALAKLAQVSKWAHVAVNNLPVDYVARMTKRVRRKNECAKKITVCRSFTSTYAQVSEKLMQQKHREQMVWTVTYEAFQEVAAVLALACGAMLGGSLMDNAIDVRALAWGFTGCNLGYMTAITILSLLVFAMLQASMQSSTQRVVIPYRHVQQVVTETISVKMPMRH